VRAGFLRTSFLFGIFVALLAGILFLNSPPSGPKGGLIEIQTGTSARAISRQLRDEHRVRSALWLEFLARIFRADQRLKAGAYRISGPKRADRLLRDLIDGRGATVRVTIPEGFALWQIAERLAAEGVCDAQEFKTAAGAGEGFLFPETYFLDPGTPGVEVVRILQARFSSVWREVFHAAMEAGAVRVSPDLAAALDGLPEGVFLLADGRRWTVRQAVTLASLIERETHQPEERVLVSAVYHNRLKKRMRLECDPTVQYALGGWKNPLYKKDLLVESPYNTYRRYGLPPGPIACPGRASLSAALAPATTDALYFVSDGAGGHRFSSTYEDHQQAVRLLRRTLRAGRKQVQ
jgi:UPF0755 protein